MLLESNVMNLRSKVLLQHMAGLLAQDRVDYTCMSKHLHLFMHNEGAYGQILNETPFDADMAERTIVHNVRYIDREMPEVLLKLVKQATANHRLRS